jgi:hypothetical protein
MIAMDDSAKAKKNSVKITRCQMRASRIGEVHDEAMQKLLEALQQNVEDGDENYSSSPEASDQEKVTVNMPGLSIEKDFTLFIDDDKSKECVGMMIRTSGDAIVVLIHEEEAAMIASMDNDFSDPEDNEKTENRDIHGWG